MMTLLRCRFNPSASISGRSRPSTAVDLDIRQDEFFALLGPSGSGKTTLLRIIAGLERPTSGRVLVRGQDVTYMPPYHRRIGMVFQNFLLFPHKTVAENIVFPLRMQSVAKARARRPAALGHPASASRRPCSTISQRAFRRPAAARVAGARADLAPGPASAR